MSNNNNDIGFTILLQFTYANNVTKLFELNDELLDKKVSKCLKYCKQDELTVLQSINFIVESFDGKGDHEPLIPFKNLIFRFLSIKPEEDIFYGQYCVNHMKHTIKPDRFIAYSNTLLSQETRDESFTKFYRQQHSPADKQMIIEYLSSDTNVKIIL